MNICAPWTGDQCRSLALHPVVVHSLHVIDSILRFSACQMTPACSERETVESRFMCVQRAEAVYLSAFILR